MTRSILVVLLAVAIDSIVEDRFPDLGGSARQTINVLTLLVAIALWLALRPLLDGAVDAVAGEVLGGGGDAALLHGLDPGCGQLAHFCRAIAHRANIGDGVIRVVVEVYHRVKKPVHAHITGLSGDGFAHDGD